MVETSKFWNGTSVGDATIAPYDAPTEFGSMLDLLMGIAVPDSASFVASFGIFPIYNTPSGLILSPLLVSGAVSPVTVAQGRALVRGSIYESTADVTVAIPTPGAATRIDLIVLRKDWALQTVRITRIAGAEGGGAPAITTTDGVTWDIIIGQVTITTGGVITLQHLDRRFLPKISRSTLPLIVAGHSVNFSIPNTTGAIQPFDSNAIENYYPAGVLHDPVTNNTRLYAAITGVYEVSASVVIAGGGTGVRQLTVFKNGNLSDIKALFYVTEDSGIQGTYVIPPTMLNLVQGDYIELQVLQVSGGPLNSVSYIPSSNYISPRLTLRAVYSNDL